MSGNIVLNPESAAQIAANLASAEAAMEEAVQTIERDLRSHIQRLKLSHDWNPEVVERIEALKAVADARISEVREDARKVREAVHVLRTSVTGMTEATLALSDEAGAAITAL